VSYAGGIFTNITHDHLDYHQTFENYLEAKHSFFTALSSDAFALINRDDENGDRMAEDIRPEVKTFGLSQASDFHCKILEKQLGGMMLRIDDQDVWTHLIGTFNAYNLLAVYGTAVLLGEICAFTLSHFTTSLSKRETAMYFPFFNTLKRHLKGDF
jgi:UDP-N-acetylmuramoyl-L-alanyl-D-glutamate--2,6-diaminopimelate ligase